MHQTPASTPPTMRWTPAIEAALDNPAAKRDLNARLFTLIAPRYNFVTRALSFGRDAAWKRALVAALPALETPRCLDLACGTGDITARLAARYPLGAVQGIDLTEPMLEIARQSHHAPNVAFSRQDMQALDVADASVDIVTGGYALRNAPSLERALTEVHRVLRLRGTAAFLDFSKPASSLGQRVVLGLLTFWGGLWGLLLHGDPGVYAYLAQSLARFPDRTAFPIIARRHGFTVLRVRRFLGGLLELCVLRKDG